MFMKLEKQYKAYTLSNFLKYKKIKQNLTTEQIQAIQVVGRVLPFKTNNYVIDELIDWNNIPNDAIFHLTFPQAKMLKKIDYEEMEKALSENLNKLQIREVADKIRYKLNPNPDGQNNNVPIFENKRLIGIQHKYEQTVLFFPSNCQTCHAYCTFCFRWPQFVGIKELKFAMNQTDLLIKYLQNHPQVTDVLFTGGDPLSMSAKQLEKYLLPLLETDLPHLQNIRIGSKALAYWPYRFISDKDSDDLLRLFEKVVNSGYHLAFMAHFSHPRELETKAVELAIRRIRNCGAEIRTQAPVMKHINNTAKIWQQMWQKQVKLGCIPYYMFLPRDTGAQHYFAVSLIAAVDIFREAYRNLSGLARTVRGPIMSADPGKIQILGTTMLNNTKAFALRFIQARNSSWVGKPFFANFNPQAIWLDDLQPLNRNKFFFQD